jgi:3-methyl-2-oxobutanoate hydroxymethyltransferase
MKLYDLFVLTTTQSRDMSELQAMRTRSKLSASDVAAQKGGNPLVMLALYDVHLGRIAEAAGIDMLLVGDSLGMAVLGLTSTAQVTLDNIIYHAQAVRRGAPNTHITGDLPFMTYQVSDEQAVASAGRLVAEAGVDTLKLEGGVAMASRVKAISRVGIPVIAHIGLLPQTAIGQGGFKVQGKDEAAARQLIADAQAVTEAGAFAIVVELVGAQLAERITNAVPIPTIGIGAGVHCDGQVLVAPDMLGMDNQFQPRFLKTYADLNATIEVAFAAYARDVRRGAYPDASHSFKTPSNTVDALESPTSKV